MITVLPRAKHTPQKKKRRVSGHDLTIDETEAEDFGWNSSLL